VQAAAEAFSAICESRRHVRLGELHAAIHGLGHPAIGFIGTYAVSVTRWPRRTARMSGDIRRDRGLGVTFNSTFIALLLSIR